MIGVKEIDGFREIKTNLIRPRSVSESSPCVNSVSISSDAGIIVSRVKYEDIKIRKRREQTFVQFNLMQSILEELELTVLPISFHLNLDEIL